MYEAAMRNLALSAEIPIVGRVLEKKLIHDYIENGVHQKGHSGVIYVNGFPGTGKSKCLTEICEYFQSWYNCNVVSVNIKHLLKAKNIFVLIYQRMFDSSR